MRKELQRIILVYHLLGFSLFKKKKRFTTYKKLFHIRMKTLETIFAIHGHIWNICLIDLFIQECSTKKLLSIFYMLDTVGGLKNP